MEAKGRVNMPKTKVMICAADSNLKDWTQTERCAADSNWKILVNILVLSAGLGVILFFVMVATSGYIKNAAESKAN